MKFNVTKKQNNSRYCAVCGTENELSLKADFFELGENLLIAIVTGREEHQSFPGRMHGGIVSALLDETLGRAAQITDPDLWAVTGELTVRFKKPVPLETPIKVVGKVTRSSSRAFVGAGFIEDDAGTIYATAQATYIVLPVNKIADEYFLHKEWFNVPKANDPKEIDIINYTYFDRQ